jgi:hypothetical protein
MIQDYLNEFAQGDEATQDRVFAELLAQYEPEQLALELFSIREGFKPASASASLVLDKFIRTNPMVFVKLYPRVEYDMGRVLIISHLHDVKPTSGEIFNFLLHTALFDKDSLASFAASYVLRHESYAKLAVDKLIEAFEHPDKEVRERAAKALGQLEEIVFDRIISFVLSDDIEIRRLGLIALENGIKLLRTTEDVLRKYGYLYVKKVRVLKSLLSHEDEAVVVGAIKALGTLKSYAKSAVNPIVALLEAQEITSLQPDNNTLTLETNLLFQSVMTLGVIGEAAAPAVNFLTNILVETVKHLQHKEVPSYLPFAVLGETINTLGNIGAAAQTAIEPIYSVLKMKLPRGFPTFSSQVVTAISKIGTADRNIIADIIHTFETLGEVATLSEDNFVSKRRQMYEALEELSVSGSRKAASEKYQELLSLREAEANTKLKLAAAKSLVLLAPDYTPALEYVFQAMEKSDEYFSDCVKDSTFMAGFLKIEAANSHFRKVILDAFSDVRQINNFSEILKFTRGFWRCRNFSSFRRDLRCQRENLLCRRNQYNHDAYSGQGHYLTPKFS